MKKGEIRAAFEGLMRARGEDCGEQMDVWLPSVLHRRGHGYSDITVNFEWGGFVAGWQARGMRDTLKGDPGVPWDWRAELGGTPPSSSQPSS